MAHPLFATPLNYDAIDLRLREERAYLLYGTETVVGSGIVTKMASHD